MLITDQYSPLIDHNVVDALLPADLTPTQSALRPPTFDFSDVIPAVNRALDKAAAPILPPRTPEEAAARAEQSRGERAADAIMATMNAKQALLTALDTAIAFATTSLGSAIELPAASIHFTSLHFGLPHSHSHPPALACPLPSLGALFLGGNHSVLIHNAPAARIGDIGLAITCGAFSPFFQVSTGSSKVFYGSHRAARSLDLTTFCQAPEKPPAMPEVVLAFVPAIRTLHKAGKSHMLAQRTAEKVHRADAAKAESLAAESEGHALAASVHAVQAASAAAVTATTLLVGKDRSCAPVPAVPGALSVLGSEILVGGFSLPRTLSTLKGLLKKVDARTLLLPFVWAGFAGLVLSPIDRLKNAVATKLRFFIGHPVDVITGSLVFTACDAHLAGALPLRLTRSYSSTWSARDSPLGRGWSHSLDEAVWLEPRHLVYRAEDGRELELPRDADDAYNPLHRLTLRRRAGDCWQIVDEHGVSRDFAPIPGDPRPGRARLVLRRDRLGHALRCRYDARARLVAVHADGGRELRFHHDETDRITQVDLPDPDGDGLVPHVRYVYDGADLVEIHDALGQVTRYRHDQHRIVEETLPGGLRFHFQYESEAGDAACVRTWGDGGVLDHRLIYDRRRRTTVVVNACNETTIYRADPRGLVTEICDPRGAVTRFEYDEHMCPTATTNALGHTTRRTHDERGNCTRLEGPDGALTLTTFAADLDLPVLRIDPAGGESRWSYDAHGRVVRHTDPLGRCTVHHHDLSSRTGSVETIVHPDGRSEQRTHDAAGRLAAVRRCDGTSIAHIHDRRGRLRRSTDDRGRVETREYDLLGRLTRHALPGGELRLFTHDPRGRVLRACDSAGDLRCSYTGLGWLVSCGDASASPYTLERDLEGRITRVAGPAGTLLRIERDAAGRVRGTVDGLGIERRLTRDLLGRVISVRRPGGKITRFTRDPAGRITTIDHDDGVRDEFTYRPDGALLSAIRRHHDGSITSVRRELDLAGRLLREHQDEHAVAIEYDLRDRPVRLRSSLGADLRLVHDDRGLARIELPHDSWALALERDRDGHEQARHLPGDVLGWWQRDRLGRPTEHGLVASRPPQIFRHRRYTWSARARLDRIDETTRRRTPVPADTPIPTNTRTDAEGRRVSADLSDGTSWKYTWTGAGELAAAVGATGGERRPPADGTNALQISYRHDALGRRICRVRDGVETRWFWHGDVPLHTWAHARDVVTWVFEPGGFTPLARLTPSSRHAIVSDHLGTPFAAIDERGQLDWSAEFTLDGRPRPVRGEPALCPFRFPGQICDPDTGVAHNRFREYDPATRSYLSPDPLGLLGGLDPYAHVADPRTQTDVFGMTSDHPTRVHTHLGAELAHDFPLADLAPALRQALGASIGRADLAHDVLLTLQSPFRAPCG